VWIIVNTINMRVFVTVWRVVNSQGEKQHMLFMVNVISAVQNDAPKLMVMLRAESGRDYITSKTMLAAS
jgi:hypothetical protein